MTRIEVVDNLADLTTLVPEWKQLSLPSPMQSPEWMLAWWEAFRASQDTLHVVTVREESGELIGLAPWYRRQGFASGATLRFLADGRACSDFQSLLCRAGREAKVVQAITAQLADDRAQRWDLLDLEGLSGSDPVMNEFQNAMSARGHVTHLRQTLNTWRIGLGGMDEVFKQFSKTQGRQVRNFINRFDKGDMALRQASAQPEQADFFISELIRLHQLHWVSMGQPGCFSTTEFNNFFRSAMLKMIESHMAEILLLEREGKIVAANAWLLQNNIGFGYQCGRDPEADAHSVGRIIQAVALRLQCNQGLLAFDFLRGDEQYKQQLRAEPTAVQRLRVVARARMSELRHTIWATCRDVRTMLKGS